MSNRDSRNPGMASALTDLQLIILPDPSNPSRNNVFLENTNSAQSVVANIEVSGSDNFDISTFSGLHTRKCYPRDFEVRVAPGGHKFIGRDRISKFDLIRLPPKPSDVRQIMSTYKIVGARYVRDESEPMPAPPTDPNACIFRYRAPIENEATRGLIYAVNVNHLYGVEFSAKPTSSGNQYWFSASVLPSWQLLVHDSFTLVEAWDIYKARFFEHVPSVLFTQTNMPSALPRE